MPPQGSWPCPLCGATGGKTDEHILTRWQHAMFDSSDLGIFVAGREQKRPYVVIRVCVSCQVWLNTTFEQPTQDLITTLYGDPTSLPLTPADLALLSAYATKQILLTSKWAEQMPERSGLWNNTLRANDYAAWRRTGRPLAGTSVWLGRIVEDSPAAAAAVAMALPELGHPPQRRWMLPAGDSIEGFGFGPFFVIWLRTARPATGMRRLSDGERFVRRAQDAGLLLRARPHANRTVTWPPPVSLDVTTHERLRSYVGYGANEPSWLG